MAPSPTSPMTPSSDVTPSKQLRRMVPVIPAIPRSLEKRNMKEDVRSNRGGLRIGTSIRPNSPQGKQESEEDTIIAQAQTPQNGAFSDFGAKGDVQKDGMQKLVGGSEEEVAEGAEEHGFRQPPPFYPKPSPCLAISTNLSSTDEKGSASEESLHTVEVEDGGKMSRHPSPENHAPLNAAAQTFHAHPFPPADGTASPTESSYRGYGVAQPAPLQADPTPPTHAIPSHLQQFYQGYEESPNISFYAPPQSSNDSSSPKQSVYQGYAYAPAFYGYSPQSHAFQHPIEFPSRPEAGVPSEQRYESQPPSYSNQSPYPVLGSQPPLTPSRTPLDPSAQPWSYSNGPPSTIPFDYGYIPSYHAQPIFQSRVPSSSQGTLKSDDFARTADVADRSSKPVHVNACEMEITQLIRDVWRTLNDCMSNQMPLVGHLLQQFNVKEYSDCRLTLVHENLRFEKTTWSLNSLLLAQSHKLRDLLKSADSSEDGQRRLEIRLTDRFVTPWAIDTALRVLYGEHPETFTLAMIHDLYDKNADLWALLMDPCLAIAAAGYVLGLENITSRGLQFASAIIQWDNLEHVLSFGLESGPYRRKSPSVGVIPSYCCSPVGSRGSDPASALNLTPPSSSTECGPERSGQFGSKDEGMWSVSSCIAEIRSASDLLARCLQWMASNLDDIWHFDPSARPLAEVDRLPITAESRSPMSKSRLSRIQFGDHPSEIHAKASDRNILVSSIVLSLPFTALKYLLDVGTQPILRQLHAIVKERERRRHMVLQSKSVPLSQRLAARDCEWVEVGYTEWVETTGDGKVTVARAYTGIDRQVSEPCTPGQQK